MSDTVANGPTGEAQQGASLVINAQYLQDLSFENPRAPDSLLQQSAPPAVGIDVDVRARRLARRLRGRADAEAEARVPGEVAFLVELGYGAVITVRNVPQEF